MSRELVMPKSTGLTGPPPELPGIVFGYVIVALRQASIIGIS